jgi:hypothetical protein
MDPMTYLPREEKTAQTPGNAATEPVVGRSSAEMAAAGRVTQAARRAEWAATPTRQDFADEAWMRRVLVHAGVRIADSSEPATPKRLVQMCRRAGLTLADVIAANGCAPARFLDLNSKPHPLPLWAAAALTLEAAGITPKDPP